LAVIRHDVSATDVSLVIDGVVDLQVAAISHTEPSAVDKTESRLNHGLAGGSSTLRGQRSLPGRPRKTGDHD